MEKTANVATLPLFLLLVLAAAASAGGVTSGYVRPTARAAISVLHDGDGRTPQQVHISAVGSDKMRISWITTDDAPATVEYGTVSGEYPFSSTGTTTTYTYLLYHSGKIHDAIIGPLQPNTTYFYRCSNHTTGDELSLRTPPSTLPFRFVVVGDLGQTGWTKSTLTHIGAVDHDMLLLPGDLSYADFYQPRWDSFGRLVEPLASKRPWMVTQGNHEVEKIPLFHSTPFTAYNARWRMPYDGEAATASGSNLYYSFDVAGGAVHVIMLGSYADYSPGSPQHTWLESDLARIDRATTAFVIALVHAPWYSTNAAHRGEGDAMRRAMEPLLRGGHVDAVFAGHVHAYERFARVYGGREDACGAVHVTVGDGGNREGLATRYDEPQPAMSVFREASFGHGRLEVVNATHALWTWHRNDDDVAVAADEVWITSLAANPACSNKDSVSLE
uniref:Purple acid phosphatase n=1 Tax=Leersia perrieri TaxID=77586 RepID=A0A0D9XWY6_9ORYZ